CLCGDYKLFFTFRQDLTAYHAGKTCPRQQAKYHHYHEDTCVFRYIRACKYRRKYEWERQEGNIVLLLGDEQEQQIHPAAEVAGLTADDDGYHRGNYDGYGADGHGLFAAVHYAGKDISAQFVRAHKVALAAPFLLYAVV